MTLYFEVIPGRKKSRRLIILTAPWQRDGCFQAITSAQAEKIFTDSTLSLPSGLNTIEQLLELCTMQTVTENGAVVYRTMVEKPENLHMCFVFSALEQMGLFRIEKTKRPKKRKLYKTRRRIQTTSPQ